MSGDDYLNIDLGEKNNGYECEWVGRERERERESEREGKETIKTIKFYLF